MPSRVRFGRRWCVSVCIEMSLVLRKDYLLSVKIISFCEVEKPLIWVEHRSVTQVSEKDGTTTQLDQAFLFGGLHKQVLIQLPM